MIVRRFLLWAQDALPGHRAEAVRALAGAYLYSDLAEEDRSEAETALTAMLDDHSALVRRALAEGLGRSPDAPRHIILALASDQPDVAELVLARSPLLDDFDLVDCAALGDERIRAAIASRPYLSGSVAAALGEIAGTPTLVRLVQNGGAEILETTLARIVERHGDRGELREALLARPDLPVEIAQAIAAALAASLEAFVTGCGWLNAERCGRATREARERTTVALSAGSRGKDVERLVAHLRRSEQLTPALLLRAMLSGQIAFAEAAFRELTGFAPERVAGILRDRRGLGFRALYDRAGLPESLRPAFEGGLAGLRDEPGVAGDARLSRKFVRRALASCEALPASEAGRLVAFLRRLESEAARDEARHVAGELADEAALEIVLKHAPEELGLVEPRRRIAA